jgi:hypothetical protein
MTQATQTKTKYAIETRGLGKKYRSIWALKDCNITVPRVQCLPSSGQTVPGRQHS